MRIIDAHTHIFPHYAELAVRVMDRCGVQCSVTLKWFESGDEPLADHLRIFNRYPGRFAVFGTPDFRRINEPGFARNTAEEMARDAGAGMCGLKIYKLLGMHYRQPDGSLWRINDERLDPIWARAGDLGLPVLIHSADPTYFWQPVNRFNFWNGVLYGEYAWWTYYRQGFPSRDELLAERNEVIARHSRTTFICPHIGSNSESLDAAADDLDALPNLYYDISARIPIMGLPGRHATRSRVFLLEFQDRILFGTDSIYDDTNVPTGIQAQSLYQPFEIPLDGADPQEKYVETSVAFMQSHLDFLTTGAVQQNPPFKRIAGGYAIQGLDLPAVACEKILAGNAERLIPFPTR